VDEVEPGLCHNGRTGPSMKGTGMKAVILVAGKGTRMRSGSELGAVPVSAEQKREADAGRKALIPFHGHPFLSYVLSELADGGIREVCLVVGPDPDDPIRRHFEGLSTERLGIRFAVQDRPRGSAHALQAARGFAGGESVMVMNGDNLYPSEVVEAVRQLPGHGLAGFRPESLIGGTITRERLSAFALIARDESDHLKAIVEKPAPEARRSWGLGEDALVSMTCWRFEPEIFEACLGLSPSIRGEFEIPDAVMRLVREEGRAVQVLPVSASVLDLTHRRDIPVVEEALRGRTVRL
jgi:dTDP-glucose pyrophosphorylase